MPDHQEVFVDNDTDCSLIFELNALSDDVADGDIGTHIFTDLAEYNDAVGHKIGLNTALTSDSAPNFPSAYKHLVVGDQTVSKYNDGDIAANNVRVYMAIIRCVVCTRLLHTPHPHSTSSTQGRMRCVACPPKHWRIGKETVQYYKVARGLPAKSPTWQAL